MTENRDDRKGGIRGDAERTDRLAAELRRNLHRRKQRARAIAAAAENKPGDLDPAGSTDDEQG
jgi:hypothetical protein